MRARIGNPFHEQHELFDPTWSFRHYDFVTHAGTNPHDVAQAIEAVVPELTLFVRGTSIKERVWDATRTNDDKRPQFYKTHWFEQDVYQQDGSPDKQGWANGVVWTSWRQVDVEQEPALHVSFGLYNQPCMDPRCLAGHMNNKRQPVEVRVGPEIKDWQLDAIEEEIGIHPDYRLERRAIGHNRDILAGLGFLPLDAPLAGEKRGVGLERVYKALDYLAREDENAVSSLGERLLSEKFDAHDVLIATSAGGGTLAYKLHELVRHGYQLDLNRVEQIIKARVLK